MITLTALQIGATVALAVITGTAVQWPGAGLPIINAVQAVDIPDEAVYLMLIAAQFVAINQIVDILNVRIAPGLRADRPAAAR